MVRSVNEQTVLGWGILCAGGIAIFGWVLLWTGRWRADWVRDYRAASAPAWRRNRAFALLPAGVCFAAGGLGALLPGSWFGLTALLWYVAVLACFIALLIVFVAPPSAKPRWVRELDESDWQNFQPTGKPIGRVLTVLMLSDVVALFVALVHRATVWDFFAPLLMGVAASIGWSAAGNRRGRRS